MLTLNGDVTCETQVDVAFGLIDGECVKPLMPSSPSRIICGSISSRTFISRGRLLNRNFPLASSPGIQSLRTKATVMATMAKRLEGKTILITGASSGIGRAISREFARTSPKDLKLVITARRLDSLEELAREIHNEVGDGVKVHPVKMDVSKKDQVDSFVENLPTAFREIDVLVNNA